MDEFGAWGALKRRCFLLARHGEQERAEQLVRARAGDGDSGSLHLLADFLIACERPAEAEAPLRQAARKGNRYALDRLIDLLDSLGRHTEVDSLRRHGL